MQNATLDSWFLRQDVMDQLLAGEEDVSEAVRYADRIQEIAKSEESEHQTLMDPFDRSVALVLALVREEGLDPWNIDLSAFLKLFTKRVRKEAKNLDLPACGRLIRLAWEVLNTQAAELFERVQSLDLEDEEFIDFGWESDYDDEGFAFTQTILAGEADSVLPNIFDERLRRTEEGRPVTLGELLSALKDACDDAEIQKVREENRKIHAEELAQMLGNVGARLHDEDLEGDIELSWRAMRAACNEVRSSEVLIEKMREHMLSDLAAKGFNSDEQSSEAKVTAFISCLFLTHRGYASISQKDADGGIIIEDLWPDADDFKSARDLVQSKRDGENLSGLKSRAENVVTSDNSEVVDAMEGWLVE